jgi:hypothetical protein
MSTHLTDGELRAALDGESGPEQLQHLEACPACQARQRQVQAWSLETSRRLAFFRPPGETGVSSRQAWARFSQQIDRKDYSMTRPWYSRPVFRFATAALALLVLALAFPSTRALTGAFLNLFRVQQVQVVPVDFTGLEQLTGDGALGNSFTELISSSVDMQQEPGEPTAAASAEEASRMAGFDVRLPAGMTPSQINVTSGASFSLTLDRAKLQALLDEAGRSDLALPASVDGSQILVDIPPLVSASFGTCPRPGTGVSGNTEQSATELRYPDCVLLVQIPSPNVNAPAGLDIDALARTGLEFTGMSPEEAAELTSTVDWTSTLLVPIPSGSTEHEQVSVDGVTGTLIQSSGETPRYVLLWVKDRIIFAISGLGAGSRQAVDMANALP